MATATQQPLVLKFGGSLVEQLGAQLYPRVTASVAELVSNAWDADARNVWITMPFGDKWRSDAAIEVLDDGHGMRRQHAANRYLVVGRNRRKLDGSEKSLSGRPLHGRKGIGKLAAFGTAGYLECVTAHEGEVTAFGIDYQRLREHDPTEDYEVESVTDREPLVNPDTGDVLPSGTRIRLKKLKAKRRASETAFRRSMARRFALNAAEMRVFINGEPLERFDYDVDIRFPRDGVPTGVRLEVDENGWANEELDYSEIAGEDITRAVQWWIGFTENPIAEEDMRGVSVLTRGKLAQRPFMFESAQGTTGQLGQEYLVGEVRADWIDHGSDADEDLIQSNRDQLQLDNEELGPFLDWGRARLRWALAQRNQVKRERRAGPDALGTAVEAALSKAPTRSRERFRTLAGRIADVTQADEVGLARAVEAVVDATEGAVGRRTGAELRLVGDPDDEQTWRLLREVEEASSDARASLALARRDVLSSFLVAVAEPPAGSLHRAVAGHPWILSPLLDALDHDVINDGDELVVVAFEARPPILDALTIACWAVGAEAGELPDSVDASLVIASGSANDHLDWAEVLAFSRNAHAALAAALEGT